MKVASKAGWRVVEIIGCALAGMAAGGWWLGLASCGLEVVGRGWCLGWLRWRNRLLFDFTLGPKFSTTGSFCASSQMSLEERA